MAGDISLCLEFTATHANFNKFNSGHIGVSWDCTGDEQKSVICKDPTCDLTGSVFYLEYLQLGCGSTDQRIYDGSGGLILAAVLVSDVTGTFNTETWDFRDDPLRCLVAESTQGLCISSGDGNVCGFLKGYWNPS
jgi:hypothetical protein